LRHNGDKCFQRYYLRIAFSPQRARFAAAHLVARKRDAVGIVARRSRMRRHSRIAESCRAIARSDLRDQDRGGPPGGGRRQRSHQVATGCSAVSRAMPNRRLSAIGSWRAGRQPFALRRRGEGEVVEKPGPSADSAPSNPTRRLLRERKATKAFAGAVGPRIKDCCCSCSQRPLRWFDQAAGREPRRVGVSRYPIEAAA